MTDLQQAHFRRAERALETARLVLDDGDTAAAANRAYYACFYAAQAILLDYGEEPRTHRGIHHRFRERAVLTGLVPPELGRTLPYAASIRERSDYEALAVTDTAAAEDLLADAHIFVDAVRGVINP